jgi:hypothetical protein
VYFFSYQVGFEDITGCVDGGLVLGHEEHGQQIAGEAQGQDQRQQLPHAKKQARRNVYRQSVKVLFDKKKNNKKTTILQQVCHKFFWKITV